MAIPAVSAIKEFCTEPECSVRLKSLPDLWSSTILLLKLCGLYHCPSSTPAASGRPTTWYHCSLPVNWKIYSICWICTSWVFFIYRIPYYLLFSYYNPGVNEEYSKIRAFCRVFWSSGMGVIGIVMFLASTRPDGFTLIYHLWSQLEFAKREAKNIEKAVRHWVWVLGVCCIFLTIFFITADVFETMIFEDASFFPTMLPFIFGFLAEVPTFFFVLLLILTITKLFAVLNDRVTDQYWKIGTMHNLDNFVHNFYLIVAMVSVVDDLFSFYLGSYILYCIIWVIFQTYLSFTFGVISSSLVFTWIWYALGIIFGLTLLWSCANIPLKAQQLHMIVHALPLDNFSVSQQNKILSLQHFISNTTVSLTLFKFHPITRGLITSIIGFCLTYLFILIQFQSR